MEILANLGELKDGRTALIVRDAYPVDPVLATGYNATTQDWAAAKYFDGNLVSFCRAILQIECPTYTILDMIDMAYGKSINSAEARAEKSAYKNARELMEEFGSDAEKGEVVEFCEYHKIRFNENGTIARPN